MQTIERGNTKRIRVVLTDEDAELVDADSETCKIAIWYQDGTVLLTATAMTRASLGTYTYLWNVSSTATIGIYHIEITATFATTKFHVNRESVYITDIISGG